MQKLFDLSLKLKKNNINLILIQIDEAHSDAWPVAVDTLFNVEPTKPHQSIQDRISRAQYFVDKFRPPFDVYIDSWDNYFSKLFRAWPDKYYCLDQNFRVIAKSEYHVNKDKDATIIVDLIDFLEGLIK